MPRSARSDTSDADAEGIAEKEMEYARLQRQYRIMEGDRRAYCQESQDLIKKQKSEVSNLEKEREELLVKLRLQESRSNQSKDESNVEQLTKIAQEKTDLDNECEEEKKKQEDYKIEIREWQIKIREQNKKMGGVNMSRQHTVQTQKKLNKLENQLQQQNAKFSDALDRNKQLRVDIDSLRVERTRFENLYKKLEKELQELKQQIGEVVDQSSQAYDQRDECQAKMILLKEKSDKDIAQHNAEMKELIRIIDHDRKLKDFMSTKGKERQEDTQLVAWRQKKAIENEKKKESQADTVETYEAAFERIKEITQEEDIDLLVNRFIEVEDRNFALFNYVNEQNNEQEMLHEQIEEIHLQIEKFKADGVKLEQQREAILKELEENTSHSSHQGDEYTERDKECMKILDQLGAGIDSLFNKISCERAAIENLLGAQSGVNEHNMFQYLGIIEERTNQLLLIQAYCNKQKDYEEYLRQKLQPNLLGEGPTPAPPQPHILPPTVGDEYESEGSEASDEDRPLTRNELQLRVMKTVKKRESAARKEGFRYDLSNAREKTKKTPGQQQGKR